MKCAKCDADAILRTGKFGEFYCCPNSKPGDNHGTISKPLLEKVREVMAVTQTHDDGSFMQAIDLDFEVRRHAMHLGVEITEMDRFIEGDTEYADDDEDYSHWSMIRPY